MLQRRHFRKNLTTEVSDTIPLIENVYRQFEVILFHAFASIDHFQQSPVSQRVRGGGATGGSGYLHSFTEITFQFQHLFVRCFVVLSVLSGLHLFRPAPERDIRVVV